ncbi:hypothetical protein BJP36_03275 [Moorena producens JHB]|uniref:Uncharacterized protein n=1 Tax=Moorena producens (strain JHB) TaxID=1454205 RepID=A0A1D9FUY2_MOOP1|nr:hypothetical protein [Moorena producens]AOY79074.1 hypothetical protein BJP36_03275 [Moorena producens JHB]
MWEVWGDGEMGSQMREFIKTMRKKVFKDTKLIQNYLFPVPYSLFPVPCSLFPVPCSLLKTGN